MEKLFFENVSSYCNYMNPKLVRDIYIATSRHLIQSLKRDGEVELPNIGKFYIKQYKERMGTNVNSGERTVYPDVMVVKFKPCRQMKACFNQKIR